MKKILPLFAIFAFLFSSGFLQAQQLFSVSQNSLPKETVAQLKTEATKSAIPALSLTKNNEDKEVYPFAFSSVENAKIIILNEQTGANVVLTPAKESPAELKLAPFFIEELKQGVLGNAAHYLILETDLDFSVRKINSITASNDEVFLPRYFYGEKENVREALPTERQIIGIFKAKPRFIPAYPNDPENLRYVAQLAEKKSYYIYLYKLPDGTLCIYDEHLYSENIMNASRADGPLQFNLSGNTTGNGRTAIQHVFELWSQKIAGKVPVDIQIDLTKMDAGVLGGSYVLPEFFHTQTNTWFTSSLYNQIVGYDATTQRDIRIEMNSDYSWYYGLDGNTPSYLMDFVSVMLHEINHGLGFSDNIFYEAGSQYNGEFYYIDGDNINGTNYPNAFCRQLFQGTSGPNIAELTQSQRAALITSGNLYAGRPGSKLLAANGGSRVKMYAPNPYEDGSSVCHWDYYVSFTTFMRYAFDYGESCHTIGAREIGMLVDMGWTENSSSGDCPGVSNMKVEFSFDCNSAQISWNAPSKGIQEAAFTEGLGDESSVRFQKEKEYVNVTKLAVYDASQSSLASYDFGTSSGTSSYFTIPSGTHFPAYYYSDGKWYYCLEAPYTYNFQKGHKYTVVCSDDGQYLAFSVKDDGGSGGDFKYNIYRDGTLVKGNHTETSYTDMGYNKNQPHTWMVKVACSGGGESTPASVNKGCNVGVGENVESSITVFPNPTTGELRVKSEELRVASIEIFDIFGKKMLEQKENLMALQSYDLTVFSAGIYFLKITTNKGIITKKIIKN